MSLFLRVNVSILFFLISASSAYASSREVSTVHYDLTADPLLQMWTLGTGKVSPKLNAAGDLTGDDKVLAKWKAKQEHLWNKLEVGKRFTVNASAYTASADECGKSDGITASGLKVAEARTLACPGNFPFGTRIAIAGMGEFRCEDRGGAITGNRIDIYMKTKREAFAFGRQQLEAEILN